jgi:hypothetical protein
MDFKETHGQEPYTPDDVEHWKRGTGAFATFFNGLAPAQQEELHKPLSMEYRRDEPVDIPALFLGERALVLESYSPDVRGRFESCGLKTNEYAVYDSEHVRRVIQRYPDVFADVPHASTEECVNFLTQTEKIPPEKMKAVGLLLGYPLSAVVHHHQLETRYAAAMDTFEKLWNGLPPDERREYVRQHGEGPDRPSPFFYFFVENLQKDSSSLPAMAADQKVFLLEAATALQRKRQFGVYGMNWSDDVDSSESKEREQRLRAAFERSGILVIKKESPQIATSLVERLRRKFGGLLQ